MFGAGMHIRRNSSLSAFNSVFAGWNTGLLLDGTSTYANANDSATLCIQNCALIGSKVTSINGAGITAAQAQAFYNTTAFGNQIITSNAKAVIATNAKDSAGVISSFIDASKTLPSGNPISFLPASNSTLLGAAKFTHTKLQDAFFDKTPTFIGAFGTIDWTKEAWTNFDPQNTVY